MLFESFENRRSQHLHEQLQLCILAKITRSWQVFILALVGRRRRCQKFVYSDYIAKSVQLDINWGWAWQYWLLWVQGPLLSNKNEYIKRATFIHHLNYFTFSTIHGHLLLPPTTPKTSIIYPHALYQLYMVNFNLYYNYSAWVGWGWVGGWVEITRIKGILSLALLDWTCQLDLSLAKKNLSLNWICKPKFLKNLPAGKIAKTTRMVKTCIIMYFVLTDKTFVN